MQLHLTYLDTRYYNSDLREIIINIASASFSALGLILLSRLLEQKQAPKARATMLFCTLNFK
jgi:hypothetical protein